MNNNKKSVYHLAKILKNMFINVLFSDCILYKNPLD